MRLLPSAPAPITSRNHPRVRRIRALQHRSEREQTGLFFTEGLRFVSRALDRRLDLEALVVAPDLLSGGAPRHLLREARRRGIPHLYVTGEVFHSLASGDEPQGMGAVARQEWAPLSSVDPAEGTCWVALTRIQSPGNLGTIARTCEAVGAGGLILLGDRIDPYDPSAMRASMGAMFGLRLVRTTAAELTAWAHGRRCLVVGTSPSAEEDYQALEYPEPVVLFMGWERQGLAPEHQALCDRMVRIPMAPGVDSLNLGVATGVMLYEVYNQRRRLASASD